jgi:hypothetical protein
MKKKAQKYLNSLYVDYGDLNQKAEEQIKQAFIDGMKEQLLIHSVVVPKGTLPYGPKCDNACKFYCTKGNTQYPECLK